MTGREWHIYRLADGALTGQSLWVEEGDDQVLSSNTPTGCGAVTGVTDWQAQRVDLETLEVVDWQPPAPANDELRTWSWSADVRRWVSTPTVAALASLVRAERDRRLAACDWVLLRSLELAQPVPTDWAAYRAALRAVPEQPGFPTSIDWPIAPA